MIFLTFSCTENWLLSRLKCTSRGWRTTGTVQYKVHFIYRSPYRWFVLRYFLIPQRCMCLCDDFPSHIWNIGPPLQQDSKFSTSLHEYGAKSMLKQPLIVFINIIQVVYASVAAILVATLYGRSHNTEFSKDIGWYQSWIYVFLIALPPTGLFAFCLCFDFSVIFPNLPSTLEPAMILPAATWSLPIGQGALAPFFRALYKIRFACPYFGSAIGAWICANVATNVLGVPGFTADYRWLAYAFGVLLLSTPLIIITVVCVAWVRGETERLWDYEELWAYDQAQDKKGLEKVWVWILD